MPNLRTFYDNDSLRLRLLALKLQEKNYFNRHLTDYQRHVLEHILTADDLGLWQDFITGNCLVKFTRELEQGDEDLEGIEEGQEPIRALALQIRYLLWEKAINVYYQDKILEERSQVPVIQPVLDDYALIEEVETLEEQKLPEPATEPIRDELDDYDVDEEDEQEAPVTSQNGASEADVERTNDGQRIIELPALKQQSKAVETENTTDLEPQSPQEDAAATLEEQDELFKSFNKVYHNFEYDRETLIKRRKLEKSDKQFELLKQVEEDAGSILINFGAGNTLLQHLLNTVQDKRDAIGLNDFELRNLFMDVRKNRGKWANDERIGQEELYDACEKVLLDLRGHTEHSTPFLNKVLKREAPNYGLIIKVPMDLNTVLKKLKTLAYNSKKEFVDDLNLIWSNCLAYNADPKHFLRAHALAMQKLTLRLAPTIPNIVIRNRTDLEKDEEIDTEAQGTPAPAGGKKSSKKGRTRKREDVIKAEDSESIAEFDQPSETTSPQPQLETEMEVVEEIIPNEELNEDEEEEMEDAEEAQNDEEEEERDPDLQAWKSLTSKSRARYCAARASLFDDDKRLNMQAAAIIRDPTKMKNFNTFLSNNEVVSLGEKYLDNDEPYLLEYDVAGGVPGLEYAGVGDDEQDKIENETIEAMIRVERDKNYLNGDASTAGDDSLKLPSSRSFVLPKDKGLNKLYRDNITEIQEIRRICFKINLIRQIQTQQYVHRTQMVQPAIEYLQENDIDEISKLKNHDIYANDVQFATLRRAISKIAMHTGFETTEPSAINTLTQVAERYLLNIARTLKLHCESDSTNSYDNRETLLLTLLENGIDKPDDLFTYVQEKAIKHLVKLKDLRQKLAGFFKDLLRPSLESLSEKSFDDNSELFTTGDFTSELGDDFFGFKELGLDKEFKLLSSSIPINLLHSRLQNSLSSTGQTSKLTKYEDLQEWETFKLKASDIDDQIGLLRPFYRDLLAKLEANFVRVQRRKGESEEIPAPNFFYLMEDDELPQKQRNIRPRLPPTGKITSIKKKTLASAYILPETPAATTTGLLSGDSFKLLKQES